MAAGPPQRDNTARARLLLYVEHQRITGADISKRFEQLDFVPTVSKAGHALLGNVLSEIRMRVHCSLLPARLSPALNLI